MNYTDFVKTVAKDSKVTQTDAKRVIDVACLTIKKAVLHEGEVTLNGVGKFVKKTRPERVGVNPATGDKMTIPAKDVVTFKPAKEFKDFIQ